jgi:hypothetical protein
MKKINFHETATLALTETGAGASSTLTTYNNNKPLNPAKQKISSTCESQIYLYIYITSDSKQFKVASTGNSKQHIKTVKQFTETDHRPLTTMSDHRDETEKKVKT